MERPEMPQHLLQHRQMSVGPSSRTLRVKYRVRQLYVPAGSSLLAEGTLGEINMSKGGWSSTPVWCLYRLEDLLKRHAFVQLVRDWVNRV